MPTPILCSPGSPLRQPASSHTHSSYEENLCYRDTRVQNFFGASTRIRASIRVGRDAACTRHAAAVSGQLRSSSARPPSTRRPPGALQLRSPFARRPPSHSRQLPVATPAQADTAARRTPACCRAAPRTELSSPPRRPSTVFETAAGRKLAAAEMEGRRRAAVETEGGGGRWRWKRRSGG